MNDKCWFTRIETRNEALTELERAGSGLYVLAALQLLAAFVLGYWQLLPALLFAGLGYALKQHHSRKAALVLAVLAGLAVLWNIACMVVTSLPTGTHLLVSLVLLWVSWRSLAATALLRQREAQAV